MKTSFKLYLKWIILAFILLALSIGFIIAGVFKSNKNTDSKNSPVTIFSQNTDEEYIAFNTNYAQPGKELTATVINNKGSGQVKYKWYINNELVKGADSSSYIPKKQDLEKFISVVASLDGTTVTASVYCSKLPVIYIDTKSSIGDEYVSGFMAMSGNEEYNVANTDFYYGDIQIKLRGNSTRNRDKHPYKISLANKCDLFGMGASKHWVLLANDIDHTLIRNKLVYDFSGDIGMEYMESINVSVVLNNSYIGVYQLCEQVRIGKTRVDIYDWEDLADEATKVISQVRKETEGLTSGAVTLFSEKFSSALKADLSWISSPHTFTYEGKEYKISDYVEIPSVTGGFLLEMDFYNFANISSVKTNFNQPLYFNSPDPEIAVTNPELMEYASKYVQSFEYALHSYDFTYHNNETHYAGTGLYYDNNSGWISTTNEVQYDDKENNGKHYTQLFDMDSLINNFLVCEFSMNWDSMKNSMFISKDVDSLAKISPEWDFDWAFGNRNMYFIDTYYPESWHTTNNYFTNEQYYQSVQWNRYLIKDPYFLFNVYNKYKEIRPTVIEDIIKTGGKLDYYREQLAKAGAANDAKWDYSYFQYNGESFKDSMDSLEEFIDTRVSWMDKQFTSFDNFVESLGYYVKDDSISIDASSDGNINITVNDNSIKNLKIQINGAAYNAVVSVDNGKASFTVPAEALKEEGLNIINVLGLDGSSNYITKGSLEENGVTNIDNLHPVQNYKVF